MRLGGRIFEKWNSPEEWIKLHLKSGYRAAYCPVEVGADDADIQAYRQAAEAADLVIAEVGAWSNPIHPDPEIRAKALEFCKQSLALAEKIGAKCTVNISGSMGNSKNGPDPANYTQACFDQVVSSVQEIIDAVKPQNTFYTLEMMYWCVPDCAEDYLNLIKAIDRDAFAVHVDPVNIINSARRYYDHHDFVYETIEALKPWIKSTHAKDVIMKEGHIIHLDECRPGTGVLDYGMVLSTLDEANPELPLMLEHLPDAEEYGKAADYIRSVAQEVKVSL